ncbi:hypothetical protein, partial [Brasilonema bromeliae]
CFKPGNPSNAVAPLPQRWTHIYVLYIMHGGVFDSNENRYIFPLKSEADEAGEADEREIFSFLLMCKCPFGVITHSLAMNGGSYALQILLDVVEI